ncbi:MAG: acyl carrier protein [Verrucomicrobia bacterium]|nr:acyl carrier protein [Verrucomicrobiota bacterium]
MGLDAVEIVMEVETVFDIRLEDAEVEKASTPRDLLDLVMRKVALADIAGCLTQRAFNLLRAALLLQLPLKRRDIAPNAPMADLVPKIQRRILLECLAAELRTPCMPNLVRPKWLVNLLIVACIALGVATAVLIFRHGLSDHRGALFFTASLIAVGTGFLARGATRACCVEFPPQAATVGDLSRWIVAHKMDLAPATPGKWTREQVAARIRDITIEQLGCAETYREDASFVQDLGMG